MAFREIFRGYSREFQGNLKEVQRVFLGCFKDVKRSVKFVSGKFQKLSHVMGVSRMFQFLRGL